MTRSLNERVNALLADVARECAASSQHRPAAGSVVLTEAAWDSEVGSAALPNPYGFAHTAVRGLVYSAGERVESTRLLLYRDPPHVLSVHDTARAAAEAGATAAWLGHRKADGRRRLRRLVGLIDESSQYESQLRAALGLSSDSMYRDMLAWAHESGVVPEKVNLMERVRQAAADRGRADYKRLTNVTHNALWAVVAGWHEVIAAQHGNIGPIWGHGLLAALAVSPYVLAGIAAADRTAGRVDARHDELAQRAAELEREAHAFAATVIWPDSKNPVARLVLSLHCMCGPMTPQQARRPITPSRGTRPLGCRDAPWMANRTRTASRRRGHRPPHLCSHSSPYQLKSSMRDRCTSMRARQLMITAESFT